MIPSSEYLTFTLDLPHLGFAATLKGDENGKNYHLVPSNSASIDMEAISESILSIIETPHHPKSKGWPFTRGDFKKLIKNPKMHDGALNVLIKWIHFMKAKDSDFLSILSNSNSELIRNSYAIYCKHLQNNDLGKDSQDNHLNTEVKKIRSYLKFKDNKLNNSECLFIVNNISNEHWNLVCLCNLRTITIPNNFMDMTKDDGINTFTRTDGTANQPFREYRPPCILVFDSLYSSPPVDSKTQELIDALRFWLTNDKEINPSSIEFGNLNLPVFQIGCPAQTDSDSCGYFVIRNIIGLISISDIIFPIEMQDIIQEPDLKSKYIYYLSQTLPAVDRVKKMKKIDTKQIMRYSPESVQVDLRQEVKILFERLRILYEKSLSKQKELIEMVSNVDRIKSDLEEVITNSVSVDLSKKEAFFVRFNMKQTNHQVADLNKFFEDEKLKRYQKTVKCFCPGLINESLLSNDPHRLPNISYRCIRTEEENRGFDFVQRSKKKKMAIYVDDEHFVDDYLLRIANGCSLSHSECSPGTGDCGFHLLAHIICKSPNLTKHQIELREILGLDQLLEFQGRKAADMYNQYSKIDCTFYVRSLFSQHIRNDLKAVEDNTLRKSFETELQVIFHSKTESKNMVLKHIDNKTKTVLDDKHRFRNPDDWKMTKRRLPSKKKGKKRRAELEHDFCDCLSNLDENKISDAYCLIVVRYLLNFCLKLKDNFLSKFQEGVEIYNAIPPSLVGLYGCNWANNDILTWFERFYLVKIFICFPGMNESAHFNVHKPSGSEFDSIDRNYEFDNAVGPNARDALDLNNEYLS